MMSWRVAGVVGALGVTMGAFGAHAVKDMVSEEALAWWRTGAQYHMIHALALGLVAVHPARPKWATVAFVAGIVLFSGSLYTMTLTELRWLGAITPFGGVCFIIGWLMLAFSPMQSSQPQVISPSLEST
jgi:uncharacterized membrane protein YgdD (TMEM256/DUF423 family)